MNRRFVALTLSGLLAGCSAQQVATVQADQTKVAAAVQGACNDANAAAALAAPFSAVPQVGAVLDYVTASCATADAVSALVTKAVSDPATIAYAENLAGDLKTETAQLSAAPPN